MCDEQTEYPWPTCQKAPSVALTLGWERHDLLADLGNNAGLNHSAFDVQSVKLAFKCRAHNLLTKVVKGLQYQMAVSVLNMTTISRMIMLVRLPT